MLGKTAGGLFWMMRYMERSENTARMIDGGLRISLTQSSAAESEWTSILTSCGLLAAYTEKYADIDGSNVVDFLLRDKANPGSVASSVAMARMNARLVRTALTREVFEAVNECWITLEELFSLPISVSALPEALQTVRQRSAFVRGALHGSMIRNDMYDFARIGTFFERAENVARILDVKYYILLPSIRHVGSAADNVQWEAILRATSSVRAYQTLNEGEYDPGRIVEHLILDKRLPRSLAFCYGKIRDNLGYLENDYNTRHACHDKADAIVKRLQDTQLEEIFEYGLHEYLTDFLMDCHQLGLQIEQDYRFTD